MLHRRATMAHSSVRLASILSMLFCIFNLATLAMAHVKEGMGNAKEGSLSHMKEAMTEPPPHLHLTYYGFENRGGPNTTMWLAAGTGQGNMSAMGTGSIFVFDNPLRSGPGNDSKVLGHHTGTAIATYKEPIWAKGGLYMMADLIFDKSSKYNGSSLTVMGTVATAYSPYMLIVPGGLGYFMGCTGHATASQMPMATPPEFVCKWDFYLKCKAMHEI